MQRQKTRQKIGNRASELPSPPRPAALPYLIVADARAAIAWYTDALGADEHPEL